MAFLQNRDPNFTKDYGLGMIYLGWCRRWVSVRAALPDGPSGEHRRVLTHELPACHSAAAATHRGADAARASGRICWRCARASGRRRSCHHRGAASRRAAPGHHAASAACATLKTSRAQPSPAPERSRSAEPRAPASGPTPAPSPPPCTRALADSQQPSERAQERMC